MNCFRTRNRNPKTMQTMQKTTLPIEEFVLCIQGCTVHLITPEGETTELAKGDFKLVRLIEEDVCLATIIKVGDQLHWPLTKDEPVVKLDALQYLFSLPMRDGLLLSYGVSFEQNGHEGKLGLLDGFLKENACFSGSDFSKTGSDKRVVNWKEFAPRIEDYNGVLAKAIAGGTGEIVKGIFKCTNAYSRQVHKGADTIISRAAEEKSITSSVGSKDTKSTNGTKKTSVNKGLKRARNISKMTEKMSKSLLNGVGIATGGIVGPMVRSKAGQKFLAMVPGEVLLASLDAVNKLLDALEVAEKQALSATSNAATNMVTKKYGENAGEATEHAFATVGHCAGTAWNIFKIRKAINPASSVPSAIVKTAAQNKFR